MSGLKVGDGVIELGENDSAMIFRDAEEEVEVHVPKHKMEDAIPPSELLMLAILEKIGTEPQWRDRMIDEFVCKHKKDKN